MRRRTRGPQGQGAEGQGALLPVFTPPSAQLEPALSPANVLRHMAGESTNRLQRWTNVSPRRKPVAKVLDYYIDNPFSVVFNVWQIVVTIDRYFTEHSSDPLSTYVFRAFAMLGMTYLAHKATSFGLNKVRGASHRDVSAFNNYLPSLVVLPVETEADIWMRRVITQPREDRPEEMETFFNWHTGMIRFLLNEAKEGRETMSDMMQAVGGILKSVEQSFNLKLVDRLDVSRSWSLMGTPSTDVDDPMSPQLLGQAAAPRSDSAAAAAAGRPEGMSDSFETASLEERREAAEADWRTHWVYPRQVPVRTSNVSAYLEAFTTRALAEMDLPHRQKVEVLAQRLRDVLLDPLGMTNLTDTQSYLKILAEESFYLVNVIRPVLQDGQAHNWRYFYAQDRVLAEAFKLLSSEQQADIIFILMSGDDQGKLLAQAILQDPSFPLTRFKGVEGRGWTEGAKDIYRGHSLSAFFKAFIKKYAGMSLEEARAFYIKSVKPDSAALESGQHDDAIEAFRASFIDQARLQLMWLTRNDTGRIKALFDKDPEIAADILFNFTMDLEGLDEDVVNASYAVEQEQNVDRPIVLTLAAAGPGNPQVDFNAQVANQDGRRGFTAFGRDVSRAELVAAVLPMMASDDAIFTNRDGSAELTAKAMIAIEIRAVLLNPEYRRMLPKAFTGGTRLGDGLRMLQRFDDLQQGVDRHFQEVLGLLSRDQQTRIMTPENLIAYLGNGANPIAGAEGAEPGFRERTIQGLQENQRLLEQAEADVTRGLLEYCERADVIEAYLKFGVAYNLPLGEATAALYAVNQGEGVRIYQEGAREIQFVLQSKEDGFPVREMSRQDGAPYEWMTLDRQPSIPEPELRQPASEERRRVVRGGAELTARGGVAAAAEAPAAVVNAASSHPMVLHAQRLYWSAEPKAQRRMGELMEYGHQSHPMDPVNGSLSLLFSLVDARNIQAIKDGVLQAKHIEGLFAKLMNPAARNDAFTLLAALLSDEKNGIEFQRCFQKLVDAHRDQLCDDAFIRQFLDWLQEDPARAGTDIVRARFAAAILMEAENQIDIIAEARADRIEALLEIFYPRWDLLTVMHGMRNAFESDEEWTSKRKVFSLIFKKRAYEADLPCEPSDYPPHDPAAMTASEAAAAGGGLVFVASEFAVARGRDGAAAVVTASEGVQPNLAFLTAEERGDIVGSFAAYFAGDVTESDEVCLRVQSAGDLLTTMITDGYLPHRAYMEALVGRLCELISNRGTDLTASTNLALVLLNALDITVAPEDSPAGTQKYELMYLVFSALTQRLGRSLSDNQFDIGFYNGILKLLGALRYKAYDSKAESVYASFEAMSIVFAAYLLSSLGSLEQQEEASSRRRGAYNLLYQAVGHPQAYDRVTYIERMAIGHLALTELAQQSFDELEPNHQALVSRAVFVLFLDLSELNMKNYAQNLHDLCEKLGGGSVSNGLRALIDSIKADPELTAHYSDDEIDVIVNRIIALNLSVLYRPLPGRGQRLCSRGADVMDVTAASSTVGTLIALVEASSDPRHDVSTVASVATTFAAGSSLSTAFEELGMKSIGEGVRDLLRSQRRAVERQEDQGMGAAAGTPRDALLGFHGSRARGSAARGSDGEGDYNAVAMGSMSGSS